MKLEQSFTVEAPVERVWLALIDVERIAPCLPGAETTGVDDTGAYQGTFTVKLGPTTAADRRTLRLEAVDEAARTATMSAKGTDKRGQGGGARRSSRRCATPPARRRSTSSRTSTSPVASPASGGRG